MPRKHWTTVLGQAAGRPAAFGIVIIYAAIWLLFDRRTFDWNAVATLGVWMMTLFIQRSNRRDTLALHAKLDELLRADGAARSELTRLDEQEPEAIQAHRDMEVRRSSRTEGTVQEGLETMVKRTMARNCCDGLTRPCSHANT